MTSAKINFSYSILFHLTTSYSSYFGGKKGISRNKTSFFLLMDIGAGRGYGRDRCDRYIRRRSSSGGWSVELVHICGAKYESLDDVELGGLGMKGGDSMPT